MIFFYAGYYFDDPAEHNRFMIWLSGFAGSMLAVVLSGNLLMLFVAWELTSVTAFVLIGFNGAKDVEARKGAFKALFITSGGALALIIGVVMLSVAAGQVLYPDEGIRFAADLEAVLRAKFLHQHDWFTLFAILIILGGLTKSAQFPFHFWLPGAMSAPTPASAYLHSATMVKAGIYLFARLSPVMYQNELWSSALLTVGLLTMLIGSYFAVKQRDLKGLLAYSTVSKLGAIVAMIGLPGQAGLKRLSSGSSPTRSTNPPCSWSPAPSITRPVHETLTGLADCAGGCRLCSWLQWSRRSRWPVFHFLWALWQKKPCSTPCCITPRAGTSW